MTRYRWYYDEQEKAIISGVVEAETFDDAVDDVKSYLNDQFDDFNGKMSIILPEEPGETTLWVWEFEEDDDFHSAHPNCLAVSY